ncbi:MAG TPA: hypothetical protein VKZ63_07565, partial [Kofleriaceae bacterium]|nr:hypothetical protein [Kofleriaceae bacterium]
MADRGIFPDLDDRVQIALPAHLSPDEVRALVDRRRALLTLYRGAWPLKVYPLGGPAQLALGAHRLALRPG